MKFLPYVMQGENEQFRLFFSDTNVSLTIIPPIFVIDGAEYASEIARTEIVGELARFECADIKLETGLLHVSFSFRTDKDSAVARKEAEYIYEGYETKVLSEIILDRILFDKHGTPDFKEVLFQNQPAFFPGFFTGIEYPMAYTRVENGALLLTHKPGVALKPGEKHRSLAVVYGGGENSRQAFSEYLDKLIKKPSKYHLNYSTWWSIPNPYNEADLLGLLKVLKENLYEPYGISFDSFGADLGWSDPNTIYKVNLEKFPRGFEGLRQATADIGSKPGFWNSPNGFFHPNSFNHDWARAAGYEISELENWVLKKMVTCACLAGEKYPKAYREAMKDLVSENDAALIMFDSIAWECNETDHGHLSGVSISEQVAENLIKTFKELREINPETWLRTTCFWLFPSPWWLMYVDSVIGTFGDDAPHGRVPCPDYKESVTTCRDFFNLQGAGRIPVPICCQEVLGCQHQSDDDFLNDLFVTIMRGHAFLSVYLNPAKMSKRHWAAFARAIKWLRANESCLMNAVPLLPESWEKNGRPDITNDAMMPDEIYGYQHFSSGRALLLLRNPGIAWKTRSITLPDGNGKADIVSLYPERRLYASGVHYGEKFDIPLAPYETLILDIIANDAANENDTAPLPDASISIASPVCRGEMTDGILRLELSANITTEYRAGVHFLLEGCSDPQTGDISVTIDGQPASYTVSGTGTGWADSRLKLMEHWTFINVQLSPGCSNVCISTAVQSDITRATGWALAWKPGAPVADSGLPQPEKLYLDSAFIANYTI